MVIRNQSHIGEVRWLLSTMLSILFETRINPSDLIAAQGHWRSDVRADVYRWESWLPVGKNGKKVNVCCWETMTQCVKNGVGFQWDGNFSIEVFSLPPNEDVLGKEQRRKARILLRS